MNGKSHGFGRWIYESIRRCSKKLRAQEDHEVQEAIREALYTLLILRAAWRHASPCFPYMASKTGIISMRAEMATYALDEMLEKEYRKLEARIGTLLIAGKIREVAQHIHHYISILGKILGDRIEHDGDDPSLFVFDLLESGLQELKMMLDQLPSYTEATENTNEIKRPENDQKEDEEWINAED